MMKIRTIISAFLLGLLVYSLNGQDYNKLVIENAQWRILYDNESTPWLDAMSGWLLRGDTTINGLQYKKLFYRAFEEVYSNVIESQYLFGFLREDTVNKIVYTLESDEYLGCDTIDQEYVLYDYSYQIGDTSQLCLQTEALGYCVLSNVYVSNIFGAERKIFQFCWGSCDFIEGIGHSQGLLESAIVIRREVGYTAVWDYCVGTDEECNVVYVGTQDNLLSPKVTIYPNPCKGSFHIKSDSQDFRDAGITVADFSGRNIRFKDYREGDNLIHVYIEEPGIYMLKVSSSNRFTSCYKIVVY